MLFNGKTMTAFGQFTDVAAEEEAFFNGKAEGVAEGHAAGLAEGQQAEYDRFWDEFQNRGNRTYYTRAFYSAGWTDTNFKPKYPFIVKNGEGMFIDSRLTSTVQPVDITTAVSPCSYLFYNSHIVTIPKLIVAEDTPYTYSFYKCSALKNITFDGTIGRDINLQWSPLTPESAWNVVQHLKYFDMDSTDFMKYTITFSAAVWEALDEYTRENELHGWGYVKDYIENDIGWRTA